MTTLTISSFSDIVTYVANTHPDFAEHGLDAELAKRIQFADHPDYGSDWQAWLGANITVLRDSVSGEAETVHLLRAAVNKAAVDLQFARDARDALATELSGEDTYQECEAAEAAVDAAVDALADAQMALTHSDCPREWDLREEGFEYQTVTACSADEALEIARDNVDRSNYDGEGTLYINVRVDCEETGEHAEDTVICEADEPACEGDYEHDWQSPHVLVGGLTENPGVHGHGGGVIITEVCSHCGCKRVTDTWAQNPTTGEQGLRSVSYEEDAYTADELQEAFGEES